MSINTGMHKEDVVHIYNEILCCHEKEWNNVICSIMDGLRDCHTDWSKSEKDKWHDFACMWNLKICYKYMKFLNTASQHIKKWSIFSQVRDRRRHLIENGQQEMFRGDINIPYTFQIYIRLCWYSYNSMFTNT